MGTRNLTMVIFDGKTRIAQYGQWDGYPEGQGVTALEFLLGVDLEHFKLKLQKCRFINARKQRDINKFMESIGVTGGWMNSDQADKYHAKYPLLTRDNGAAILELVDECKDRFIWLHDQSDFAADSLFCEWAYVIDLDKMTFEVYKGFVHKPIEETERFHYLTEEALKEKRENPYYPIKLFKTFSLNELPDKETFLGEMESLRQKIEKEEEDEE